jgi:hypothetical protein
MEENPVGEFSVRSRSASSPWPTMAEGDSQTNSVRAWSSKQNSRKGYNGSVISYSACSTSEKVDEDHAALAISSSVEAAKAAWMAVTN